MANQPEAATYDSGVYQIETADPVQGGSGGLDNKALLNLANRTAYLKAHVDALETAAAGWAPIASPTFTGTVSGPTATSGDSTTKFATTAFVQNACGGIAAVTGLTNANVTLSAAQYGCGIITLAGTLTGNINIVFPTQGDEWVVMNNTTGAFTVTCKTAAGSGVIVTQGKTRSIICDATNIAWEQTDYRIKLTADLTINVGPSGSDSTGDGSALRPFATGQKAVNVLFNLYDAAGYNVSINRLDSTAYTDPVIVIGRFVGQSNALIFTASAMTAVTVTVSTAGYCYEAYLGAAIHVENHHFINSVGSALYASQLSRITYSACNFGAASASALLSDRGSQIIGLGPCTISGSMSSFANADDSGVELGAGLITLTGTPAWGGGFVLSSRLGAVNCIGTTFTGSATGPRYVVKNNAVIDTNGGGASFLPGNSVGTNSNGLYV